MENNPKMAITPKGLRYLLVGLIVMVSGYVLMSGGGSTDRGYGCIIWVASDG